MHCNAMHCTAMHCTALHCVHCIALHCIALHCIALYCTAMHCTALQCTCIALHCIALHCTAMNVTVHISCLLVPRGMRDICYAFVCVSRVDASMCWLRRQRVCGCGYAHRVASRSTRPVEECTYKSIDVSSGSTTVQGATAPSGPPRRVAHFSSSFFCMTRPTFLSSFCRSATESASFLIWRHAPPRDVPHRPTRKSVRARKSVRGVRRGEAEEWRRFEGAASHRSW